jgi:predicted nucleic acid-binding protein
LDQAADDELVIDASALVELMLSTVVGDSVERRIKGRELHAPAHIDAEVLSALGRLQRAGQITEKEGVVRLKSLVALPLERHRLPDLLLGAWRRRENVALVDGFYVELAARLQAPLITADSRLSRATRMAELIT